MRSSKRPSPNRERSTAHRERREIRLVGALGAGRRVENPWAREGIIGAVLLLDLPERVHMRPQVVAARSDDLRAKPDGVVIEREAVDPVDDCVLAGDPERGDVRDVYRERTGYGAVRFELGVDRVAVGEARQLRDLTAADDAMYGAALPDGGGTRRDG